MSTTSGLRGEWWPYTKLQALGVPGGNYLPVTCVGVVEPEPGADPGPSSGLALRCRGWSAGRR